MYYTSGGVGSTAAQRAAADLMCRRWRDGLTRKVPSRAGQHIADAKRRKVSDNVSNNANLVHARELDITAIEGDDE